MIIPARPGPWWLPRPRTAARIESTCRIVHDTPCFRAPVHRRAQRRVAQARPPNLHGHRARAPGGASRPGVPGVRAPLAGPRGARGVGTMAPLAGALRSAALWLRRDHAGGDMAPLARLLGPVAPLVDGRVGHSVLASHRARAAPGAGDRRAEYVRMAGSGQYRSALDSACGSASVYYRLCVSD